ncbi:MAG: cbb3-type cytochrome oxidase assembly protein CcoS [Flavobacteriaceae bacterium]|nr:cbb3-type cytochrome oxidase assembly protein CcoS [Flavobacteriaceae bacterium]
MDIIFLMISVSIIIAIVFFILFIKSVRSGQYDDLHTPAIRMLFDDEFITKDPEKTSSSKSIKPIQNK